MAGMRTGLLREIVGMAFDTLRTSKMRSALTVLGVVIGITSIVGMTSLIRGFDNSLRDSISQLGPDTIMVQKWGALSFAAGRSFLEVARRPNLTMEDARAIERECPSVALVDVWLGMYRQLAIAHLLRPRAHQAAHHLRRHRELGRGQLRQGRGRPPLHPGGSRAPAQRRGARQRPWQSLFPNVDPIGKTVRIGSNQFTVIGVLGKRPSPGGFSTEVDDFAVIPYGAHEKFYGKVLRGSARISASSFNPAVFRTAMIAVVPRAGMRDAAMREVEAMMRVRHRLKLDEANDFDLATQDAVLQGVGADQPGDVPRARRHQLDRADGRRHRRDGDHDDLGHRAHARDRRAQGPRRPPPRDPLAVPDRGRVPDLGRRRHRHHLRQRHRPARPLGLRLPRLAARGGRSPSASASPPASASSSASSPPSRRRGWIRSKR